MCVNNVLLIRRPSQYCVPITDYLEFEVILKKKKLKKKKLTNNRTAWSVVKGWTFMQRKAQQKRCIDVTDKYIEVEDYDDNEPAMC